MQRSLRQGEVHALQKQDVKPRGPNDGDWPVARRGNYRRAATRTCSLLLKLWCPFDAGNESVATDECGSRSGRRRHVDRLIEVISHRRRSRGSLMSRRLLLDSIPEGKRTGICAFFRMPQNEPESQRTKWSYLDLEGVLPLENVAVFRKAQTQKQGAHHINRGDYPRSAVRDWHSLVSQGRRLVFEVEGPDPEPGRRAFLRSQRVTGRRAQVRLQG